MPQIPLVIRILTKLSKLRFDPFSAEWYTLKSIKQDLDPCNKPISKMTKEEWDECKRKEIEADKRIRELHGT